MRCCVCEKRIPPRRYYCDSCRDLLGTRKDRMKRRMALKAAYDPSVDGFRCHWSSVPLEEKDYTDPFHLCFDHYIPIKTSRLVVSSELFNKMKYTLTPDEFHRVVTELVAHHNGKPFDRDCVAFEHWKDRQPSPPEPSRRLHPEERTIVDVEECVICGRPPVKWSYYCPQCRKFVLTRKGNQRDRVRAMKEAWSADVGGYLCRYTGARVDVDDPGSPWYLTFDHATPDDKATLVVSSAWANAMKTALSEDEFRKVVRELDASWREEREFDKGIVPFEHWRRVA